MTRSIPIEKAYDDALIAYAQNGEALRPEQGYPARLLLPGFEGSSNVKWIRRIELADRPVHDAGGNVEVHRSAARRHGADVQLRDGRQVDHHRARLAGSADRPGLVGDPRPRLERPRRITRVDVSADGGRTWQAATLDEPVLPKCHTRFRLPWRWSGGEALLMSRATDETGYVQPTTDALASRARTVHVVSLQQYPRVESRRGRHRAAGGFARITTCGEASSRSSAHSPHWSPPGRPRRHLRRRWASGAPPRPRTFVRSTST